MQGKTNTKGRGRDHLRFLLPDFAVLFLLSFVFRTILQEFP